MKYLLILFFTSTMFNISSFGQKSGEIQVGQPIQNDLSVNDSHVYSIYLDSGKFIYGEVFQKNIDTRSIVYGPDGKQRFRHLGEERGIDPIQFVTDQSGIYRFIIQSVEKKNGRYTFTLKRTEPIAKTPELEVDQLMHPFNNSKNPGAAIGVIKNGKIVFAKGYGMASLEYAKPITTKTSFQIASLSKQFTAFAIALLAKQGKLSLSDDIHKYIPELPDYGYRITLLNLIHHTGGLRDQWDLWEFSGRRMDDILSHEDLIRLIKQQQELNFEPGTKMSYTNSGYTLLAEVVQKTTGLTFREWMYRNVFMPLQMSNTIIEDNYKENIPGQATSYRYSENGIIKSPLNSNNFGPTGVVSTVEDLIKWMRNFHTGKVGGLDVVRQVQERGVLSNGDTTYYGFGLGVGKTKNFVRLHHDGGMAGYASTMVYYPQLDAGVILLSNNKNVLAGYFGRQILDFYFPELRVVRPPTKAMPNIPLNNYKPEYLEQFVGEYTMKSGSAMSDQQFIVRREGDRLFIGFKDQRFFELTPFNDTLFKVKLPDSEIQLSFYKEMTKEIRHGNITMNGNYSFKKTEINKLTPDSLACYQGRYYSPELETIYTISVNSGYLILSDKRTEDVILDEGDEKDLFTGAAGGKYWIIGELKFLRNGNGNIKGLRISSDRIVNLLFSKL